MKQDTKLKMIESALDLFHRKGVNATSVDDILEASGTGKSQFTHYFKTKAGLVQAGVRHLSEMIHAGEAGTGYEIRNWKEMENWFQAYIDFQKSVNFERSCPIGTIGNDLVEDVSATRNDIVTFLEWGRNELSMFFAKKIGDGEMPKSVNARGLADLCIATMQGGMLLTKIRRDSDMFSSASSEVLTYIKHLRQTARKTSR